MKTGEKPTRERLIEAAVRRFYRDGFRNVGIDPVYTEVGLGKTAFYKHFESKEDLTLAVLAVFGANWRAGQRARCEPNGTIFGKPWHPSGHLWGARPAIR
jgi:AcrR family transcriptional regulator